jgi:hypothetical protein
MKTLATLLLLATLAPAAGAAVIWDESVNGDLSTDPNAPTPIVFANGSNTITGTVSNSAAVGGDRDYITFTISAVQVISEINLLAYSPDNLSFLALNAGSTSFVPSAATNASFLSGIHVGASLVGSNLLIPFTTSSVTTNHLSTPLLMPGTYCFMIQQTNNIVESYSLEFVVQTPLPATNPTWGKLKSLYH